MTSFRLGWTWIRSASSDGRFRVPLERPPHGTHVSWRLEPLVEDLQMHLSPDVVDTVADYMAIFVLVFVPGLLIYLFWMIHILPEKIAERRGHPQADAIKTLCLLSLVFGGLLWPIAWLWAYSKPVMYKMAYGTDRVEHPAAPHDHAVPSGTDHDTVDHVAPTDADLAPVGGLKH